MSDQPQSPTPADESISLADAEVDRLLREATNLAAEIVEETGLTQQVEEVRSEPESLDAQPDPEVAVAQVSTRLDDLQEQLGEPLAAVVSAPESAPEMPPAAVMEATQDRVEVPAPSSVEPILSSVTSPTPESVASSVAETKPEVEEVSAEAGPSRRNLFLTALPALGRFALSVVMLPLRVIVILFEILDRPFARLSIAAKQAIGLAAMITLIMGAASFVLPGMLTGNPYAHIPLYNFESPQAPSGH